MPESVWGRARAVVAELKSLHDVAHQQDERELTEAVREAIRVFEHDNFIQAEARNHHR